MTIQALKCPNCSAGTFEIAFKKDEAVGTARCTKCSRDYLLLDSEDYWFDVIQTNYPRDTRCSCSGLQFAIEAKYDFRDDGDVRKVSLTGACLACGKAKRFYSVDIDYSPTKRLIDQPLVPCFQPKLLYDLREYSLYATPADIVDLVGFLADDLKCGFWGCFREKPNWVYQAIERDHLISLINETDGRGPSSFSYVYASLSPVTIEPELINKAKHENIHWKHEEVIRLSSPTNMQIGKNLGLLYYLSFANECVTENLVTPKSVPFRKLSASLDTWLKGRLVSWRGKDAFDNPEEHVRIFGDEFRGRKKK